MPASATVAWGDWRPCFLDSCATLGLQWSPVTACATTSACFTSIENGYQVEDPDQWMRDGHPWEVERPEYTQTVRFGGRTEHFLDQNHKPHTRWVDTATSSRCHTTSRIRLPQSQYTLRLWSASATDEFNLLEFNAGDYADSVATESGGKHHHGVVSERFKRKRQGAAPAPAYFLTSASLQDVFFASGATGRYCYRLQRVSAQ